MKMNYVPMNRYIVRNMVHHLNHNSIAFPCHQSRSWEFPIHAQKASCVAQSCHVQILDLAKPIWKEIRNNEKQCVCVIVT